MSLIRNFKLHQTRAYNVRPLLLSAEKVLTFESVYGDIRTKAILTLGTAVSLWTFFWALQRNNHPDIIAETQKPNIQKYFTEGH